MADKPEYFQSALSNFATDFACGGAVRHLTDLGLSLDQIMERLDYPAPRAKVQKLMMEHLYESKVLLKEEPSDALFRQRDIYVQEQDSYGRRSMRKICGDSESQSEMTEMTNLTPMSKDGKIKGFAWNEIKFDSSKGKKLTNVLHQKCEENGEQYCYVSCEFSDLNGCQGSLSKVERLSCLNGRQREYLAGIIWEAPVIYHRLDQRMREIIVKLYEAGEYSGACYFMKAGRKMIL